MLLRQVCRICQEMVSNTPLRLKRRKNLYVTNTRLDPINEELMFSIRTYAKKFRVAIFTPKPGRDGFNTRPCKTRRLHGKSAEPPQLHARMTEQSIRSSPETHPEAYRSICRILSKILISKGRGILHVGAAVSRRISFSGAL